MIKLDGDIIDRAIKASAENDLKTNEILGACVYVSQNGRVLTDRAFGYKTADKKIPLEKEHIFRLASMTKPIIAVAVVKLIEDGKLDLYDRADKFIDGFNGFYIGKVENGSVIPTKKAVNPIRVIDLLTHSSGLVSGAVADVYYRQMTQSDKKDLDSVISFYKKTCLSFEPACGNEYSATAAFDVLAKIVEIVSDSDIEDYLKREIFEPLDMADTTFTPSEKQWSRIVDMQDVVDGKSVKCDMKGCIFSDLPVSYKCGGAGLVSTIGDYAAFAGMLCGGGEYKGRRILSKRSVEAIGSPQIPEKYSIEPETWGLGVRVVKDKNIIPKGCFGWSGAYGTHFWVDPENEIVAVYMRNSVKANGSAAETARRFERDVYGK